MAMPTNNISVSIKPSWGKHKEYIMGLEAQWTYLASYERHNSQ